MEASSSIPLRHSLRYVIIHQCHYEASHESNDVRIIITEYSPSLTSKPVTTSKCPSHAQFMFEYRIFFEASDNFFRRDSLYRSTSLGGNFVDQRFQRMGHGWSKLLALFGRKAMYACSGAPFVVTISKPNSFKAHGVFLIVALPL